MTETRDNCQDVHNVTQLETSLTQPKTSFDGGGEGGGKTAVVANWQILKSVVLFWSLNF